MKKFMCFQHMQHGIIQLIPHAFLFRGSCFGCADIAEHQLGQLLTVPVPPAPKDIFHAAVDLCSRLIREGRVNHTLVQSQLSSVSGDFEHIILSGVYSSSVDPAGAFHPGVLAV